MNPRIRSRIPASIGSNQASPANKDAACAPCIVVLLSPMAWSPSARQRRSWLVEQAGDYATIQFHHLRDGTPSLIGNSEASVTVEENDDRRPRLGTSAACLSHRVCRPPGERRRIRP